VRGKVSRDKIGLRVLVCVFRSKTATLSEEIGHPGQSGAGQYNGIESPWEVIHVQQEIVRAQD